MHLFLFILFILLLAAVHRSQTLLLGLIIVFVVSQTDANVVLDVGRWTKLIPLRHRLRCNDQTLQLTVRLGVSLLAHLSTEEVKVEEAELALSCFGGRR